MIVGELRDGQLTIIDRLRETVRLALLLRLAVLWNRSRKRAGLPSVGLKVHDDGIALKFPSGWLAGSLLTVADLEREQIYLQNIGFELDFD